MFFNKYHDYQFLYLDKKIKERKKKSNDVKLSRATPTSLYYNVKPKLFNFWLTSSCCAT